MTETPYQTPGGQNARIALSVAFAPQSHQPTQGVILPGIVSCVTASMQALSHLPVVYGIN